MAVLSFLTMYASADGGVVNLDILNHYVLGLQNGFMPYILIIVVIGAVVFMFPEAREFLGGLAGKFRG